ncbi:polysaccharide biosynthesis/export family protein [Pseudolabrys sp. FHR47]|uniref:polysaccharide biosynthesis/export family protein n=1 Tax=Pseudolabrys sp. FHR47 TaxID=2562284 RepID=UPI0010BE9C8D|nr:polysaccharide biosynthesis/export family protein [Pseudolabrys sp. FHR47]
MAQLRLILLCVWPTFVLAGCTGGPATYQDTQASSYGPPPTRGTAGPYVLGPGDKVRLKIYGDADVNGDYEVNSAGFVSIPLVGQVKAAGLTTPQLENALMARMRGKVANDPKVNVEITTYAPFYVHGEVKKAGIYPFQPGLTVADAIATAGGLTYRANEDKVLLRRAGSNETVIVPVEGSVRVYPGDNLRVAERYF